MKDLWYYHDMLCCTCPELLKPASDLLEKLGDTLGDDHDLCVLDEVSVPGVTKRDRRLLKKAIETRQRQLREEALVLGVRLYAEKPSAFCHRIAMYWRAWRKADAPEQAPKR